MRRRFWVEAVPAGTSALLLLLTLISREWIELIFGVDPDRGSGAAEWLIVTFVAALAFTCSALARIEWRFFLGAGSQRAALFWDHAIAQTRLAVVGAGDHLETLQREGIGFGVRRMNPIT